MTLAPHFRSTEVERVQRLALRDAQHANDRPRKWRMNHDTTAFTTTNCRWSFCDATAFWRQKQLHTPHPPCLCTPSRKRNATDNILASAGADELFRAHWAPLPTPFLYHVLLWRNRLPFGKKFRVKRRRAIPVHFDHRPKEHWYAMLEQFAHFRYCTRVRQ